MAKLQEYEFKKLGQQAVDFHDDIRDIINAGKVAHSIVTAVPAWAADNGEMAFYDGGTSATLPGKRIYVRLSSSWEIFATSPTGGLPDAPPNSVQFNSGGILGGDAEFLWDSTGRTVRIAPASSGIVSPIFLANTNAAVGGTTRAIHVPFGFGTTTDGGLIRLTSRSSDDAGGNGNSSFLSFHVKTDGTLVELLRIGRIAGIGGGVGVKWTDPQQDFCVGGITVIGAGYDPNTGTATPSTPANGLAVQGNIVIGGDSTHPAVASPGLTIRADGDLVGGTQTAEVNLVGDDGHDIPASIQFGDTGDSDRGRVEMTVAGGNPNQNYLQVSYSGSNSGGFVNITDISGATVSSEDPVLSIGGLFGEFTAIQFQSGNTIARQRGVLVQAFSVRGLGTVATTTIGALATLYIEGACGTSNLTITTGNYALWVDAGDVRIDGNIITGAGTTETRVNGVFFTTTAVGVASNNAGEITLIRGIIGTTSLVANTLSEGRTIRLTAWGYYNTPATPGTVIFNVKLSGATVLSTSSQTITANASTLGWSLNALLTCQTSGGAGTLFCQGNVPQQTSATAWNSWQMVGSSAVTYNTTGGGALEMTVQWGTANAQSQIFLTNAVGELLN